MDKLLRNQDPLLYDSVMKELTEINSLKNFQDKVLIIDKGDIGCLHHKYLHFENLLILLRLRIYIQVIEENILRMF